MGVGRFTTGSRVRPGQKLLGLASTGLHTNGYSLARRILFERLGCNYVKGLRKMQWIQMAFQPGGPLHDKLDGSTPFRQPDAWRTVRGRSWAIHDGILGEPWHGIKMYKRVKHHAGVDTFPGGAY